MADQLNYPGKRRGQLLVDPHHEPVHELAAVEVVAVVENSQTIPPPAQWPAIERVSFDLAETLDFEVAEAAVRSYERLQLEGRHICLVIEQRLHPAVGLRFSDLRARIPQTLKTRGGSVKSVGHQIDDRAKGAEDVEPKTHWLEASVVPRSPQESEQTVEADEQVFGGGGVRGRAFELPKDRLAVADGRHIRWRCGEHILEKRAVGFEPLPADLDRKGFPDELGEKEIVGELGRHPVTVSGRHGVELAVQLAGARPPEKGEVEQVHQAFRVRTGSSVG